ncbi:MAG: RNA methyltransferase [Desulfobacterales bacterium]|nr:RNA methyltransferase [Desulfobacterales bacterium]MBS3754247.1 RNA methyltransferase [Desulfobacterales bacterium]
MDKKRKKQLIHYLSGFATQSRLDGFERVLASRTRYIAVALENIFQPHNASAVLRSMDCFGIQDAHIIENEYEYRVNPDVAMGASKWLTLTRSNSAPNNIEAAIRRLRADGYRIVATTPHVGDTSLGDFDLHAGKAALFFGTELEGLSDTMLQNADEFLRVPMYGFTESFNISVSAAIILYELSRKLRQSGIDWHLSEAEKTDLRLEWLKQSVRHSDLLIRRYLDEHSLSSESA